MRILRAVSVAALVAALALPTPAVGAAPAGSGSTPPIAARLADALAAIPPAAVPSGRLLDRTLPFARLEELDGRPGAPAITAARWRQTLDELRRAADAEPAWPAPDALRARGRALAPGAPVPIAVLDAAWNRLRPDGLADGALVRGRDGRLTLARPDGMVSGRAFAAAPLLDEGWRGAATFVVDPALWLGDRAAPPAVDLDLDDGRGWRTAHPGEPVEARWSTPGPRTVRLRVPAAPGAPADAAREAAFTWTVRALGVPAPDDTLRITATEPWMGDFGSASAYVYKAPGHATLRFPVLVIEGFDLEDTYDWEPLYELLNQEGLLETLRQRGFDAVVLDFDDATDWLQRNAFVVAEAIRQVDAMSDGPGELAVVGASMGGLLARYALAWLEDRGESPPVRLLLSFDAPHGGADIPLGLQYWLDFFQGQSTEAAFLLSRLDTPASRQMLVHHHTTPPGTTGEADPLRAAFLADLAALGDWPAAPRLAAVANGSGIAAGQGFAPAEQLIRYVYESFLVDITGNVWAVPDGGPATIFDGKIDFILLPATTRTVTVGGTLPWDGAPGGYRGSLAQMDTTAVPYGDIIALWDNHCFVPTVSSLALAVTDPFFDVAGAPDLPSLTPFDATYWPDANQEHVSIDATSAGWILDELGAGAVDAPALPVTAPGTVLALLPGGPNPFRDATTVRFLLDGPRRVTVDVIDVAGRRVASPLLRAPLPAGAHAITWPGAGAPRPAAGVYWVRVRTDDAAARARVVRVD